MANRVIIGIPRNNDGLKHFGVLGMKWGVRKKEEPNTRGSGGRSSSNLDYSKSRTSKQPIPNPQNRNIISDTHKSVVEELYYNNNKEIRDKYRALPEPFKYTADNYYSSSYSSFSKTTGYNNFLDELNKYISDNNGVSSFDELSTLADWQTTMNNASSYILANDKEQLTEEEQRDLDYLLSKEDLTEEEKSRLMQYTYNCSNCAAVYELRRRGYNVEAMPYSELITNNCSAYSLNGKLTTNSLGAFNDYAANYKGNFEWNQYEGSTSFKVRDLTDQILEYSKGNDQRGYLTISGHIMNYEVKNNEVNYIDVQDAGINNERMLRAIDKSEAKHIRFARTDNLELDISILSRVRNYNDPKINIPRGKVTKQ